MIKIISFFSSNLVEYSDGRKYWWGQWRAQEQSLLAYYDDDNYDNIVDDNDNDNDNEYYSGNDNNDDDNDVGDNFHNNIDIRH